MGYQEWAAFLRKKFPDEFGEMQDPRAIVKQAMDYWPKTDYREQFGQENYNELMGLQESGAPETAISHELPRYKRLAHGFAQMASNIPTTILQNFAKENPDDPMAIHREGMRRKLAKDPISENYYYDAERDAPKWNKHHQLQERLRKSEVQELERQKNAVVRAEKYRKAKDEWFADWRANDPELEGWLKYNEDNPLGFADFWNAETFAFGKGSKVDMVERGLTQAIPSLAAFIGAGMIGGPAAAMSVAFGLGKSGSQDETMRTLVDEYGMDPAEAMEVADVIGNWAGGGEMVLESLGGGTLARALGIKKFLGKGTNSSYVCSLWTW